MDEEKQKQENQKETKTNRSKGKTIATKHGIESCRSKEYGSYVFGTNRFNIKQTLLLLPSFHLL
jgi:hypothetical protein